MLGNKVKTLVRYAKVVAKKAKKKGKPVARKILPESIKLERMIEGEAKKILREKGKKKR